MKRWIEYLSVGSSRSSLAHGICSTMYCGTSCRFEKDCQNMGKGKGKWENSQCSRPSPLEPMSCRTARCERMGRIPQSANHPMHLSPHNCGSPTGLEHRLPRPTSNGTTWNCPPRFHMVVNEFSSSTTEAVYYVLRSTTYSVWMDGMRCLLPRPLCFIRMITQLRCSKRLRLQQRDGLQRGGKGIGSPPHSIYPLINIGLTYYAFINIKRQHSGFKDHLPY